MFKTINFVLSSQHLIVIIINLGWLLKSAKGKVVQKLDLNSGALEHKAVTLDNTPMRSPNQSYKTITGYMRCQSYSTLSILLKCANNFSRKLTFFCSRRTIPIGIVPENSYERNVCMYVELGEPEEGMSLVFTLYIFKFHYVNKLQQLFYNVINFLFNNAIVTK